MVSVVLCAEGNERPEAGYQGSFLTSELVALPPSGERCVGTFALLGVQVTNFRV